DPARQRQRHSRAPPAARRAGQPGCGAGLLWVRRGAAARHPRDDAAACEAAGRRGAAGRGAALRGPAVRDRGRERLARRGGGPLAVRTGRAGGRRRVPAARELPGRNDVRPSRRHPGGAGAPGRAGPRRGGAARPLAAQRAAGRGGAAAGRGAHQRRHRPRPGDQPAHRAAPHRAGHAQAGRPLPRGGRRHPAARL
ncbi:MAG: hypothetical protein AVDCRST_MAG68-4643, partial [uncultured Gemmatimonadetes bacterium]